MIDDLHARVPVDFIAARIFSKGTDFVTKKNIQGEESDTPIQTRPITKEFLNNLDFSDLTGVKFGRLKVVGLHHSKTGRWVCRCVCGKYVVRKSRSIKNPENYGDRCGECQELAYQKKKDYFNRTGIDLDQRDL